MEPFRTDRGPNTALEVWLNHKIKVKRSILCLKGRTQNSGVSTEIVEAVKGGGREREFKIQGSNSFID